MYKIRLSNVVLKQLDKIPTETYDRIYSKLKVLADNPRPSGCVKLSDSENYRIRIGNFRIIYFINDTENTIDIFTVLHRKDAYKKK